MTTDCSIILLAYNGGALIRETIAAVLAQKTRHSFEIIAIDSGSRDGTAQWLATQPVRLVQIPNSEFGHGKTRNLGGRLATEAGSPLIVFMSQDAVPSTTDWLENLLAPLEDSGIGAVHGRQLPRDTHICERNFLETTYPDTPARHTLTPGKRLTLRDIFLSNVNSACRREVWEQCPFDETLVMSEDQQWAKDILHHGWDVYYEPRAAVYHSHRYTLGEVFKRYFDSGSSLRVVVGGQIGGSSSDHLGYIWKECKRTAREESVFKIPYVLAYEVTRVSGYIAGLMEPWMPTALKIRLSSNRRHWMKNK